MKSDKISSKELFNAIDQIYEEKGITKEYKTGVTIAVTPVFGFCGAKSDARYKHGHQLVLLFRMKY